MPNYDNAGNKTSDGSQIWTYGSNNRPTTISITGSPLTTVQAGINALGQRVTKTVNGTITRFVYDEQGKLIGEYQSDGTRIREHIWLNDLPVAVVK